MWGIHLNPITRKRLRRFKEMKRAYCSFWILVLLYGLSLGSELICNSVPLYVRYAGESYFPVFKFSPDDHFTGSGKFTRPDYKKIATSVRFKADPGNRMIFPVFPYGPYEVIDPQEIVIPDQVTIRFTPQPRVGSITIAPDLSMTRSLSASSFFGLAESELKGKGLTDYWTLPARLTTAIAERFQNRACKRISLTCRSRLGAKAEFSLPAFTGRRRPPQSLRLTIREPSQGKSNVREIIVDNQLKLLNDTTRFWPKIPAANRALLLQKAGERWQSQVESVNLTIDAVAYRVSFIKEEIRFPFRPVKGHWLGIDSAGRDVLARILYGLRTSMTFGLVLVFFSVCIGTVIGAMQGYFGGLADISAQRLIEIWSALPFLYVMILMGSVYGRSLGLLIVCYGLFNWIGISYYMRAELLRLRRKPFVEAARCLGLPTWKIVFKHILPNALIPLITLFPFSLVGAIGSLAALDYLGFGLPPPTASWGELLQQAQQFRWAWWLILYPSLALFLVMLLGVFVGEGIRNAFDPRRYSRLR